LTEYQKLHHVLTSKGTAGLELELENDSLGDYAQNVRNELRYIHRTKGIGEVAETIDKRAKFTIPE
jgi:hypothetical protein